MHEQHRRKLGDRSEVMLLVGYHPTGVYKLYDPVKKKVSMSRNVVIAKSESWNWKENIGEEPRHSISDLLDA